MIHRMTTNRLASRVLTVAATLAMASSAFGAELGKLKDSAGWPVVVVVSIIVLCTFLVSIKPSKREHRD